MNNSDGRRHHGDSGITDIRDPTRMEDSTLIFDRFSSLRPASPQWRTVMANLDEEPWLEAGLEKTDGYKLEIDNKKQNRLRQEFYQVWSNFPKLDSINTQSLNLSLLANNGGSANSGDLHHFKILDFILIWGQFRHNGFKGLKLAFWLVLLNLGVVAMLGWSWEVGDKDWFWRWLRFGLAVHVNSGRMELQGGLMVSKNLVNFSGNKVEFVMISIDGEYWLLTVGWCGRGVCLWCWVYFELKKFMDVLCLNAGCLKCKTGLMICWCLWLGFWILTVRKEIRPSNDMGLSGDFSLSDFGCWNFTQGDDWQNGGKIVIYV